jgi:predicted nucleic acid-binding protein
MAGAREVLTKVALIDLEPDVVELASSVEPLSLSSLDAIHLSSALVFSGELKTFVTYDTRLAAAAGAAGLEVVSPS